MLVPLALTQYLVTLFSIGDVVFLSRLDGTLGGKGLWVLSLGNFCLKMASLLKES